MRSFVQARYVHWCSTVGECPIHKNTFVVVQLSVKASCEVVVLQLFLSYSVSRQCLGFFPGRISFPALLSRELNRFFESINTTAPLRMCNQCGI